MGLRPQIDSHEASKGLQMNHKVNSNVLTCSPPCFCVPHLAPSNFPSSPKSQSSESDFVSLAETGYNRDNFF